MNKRKQYTISLIDVIQVQLIILKMFDLIDWSWGKVFIPTGLVAIAVVVALICEAIYATKDKKTGHQ